MLAVPVRLVRSLSRWHLHSQEAARRNALVACTALAERRREVVEVEEFLAAHAADRVGRTKTLEVAVRPA